LFVVINTRIEVFPFQCQHGTAQLFADGVCYDERITGYGAAPDVVAIE
jgi:hypothetical protein